MVVQLVGWSVVVRGSRFEGNLGSVRAFDAHTGTLYTLAGRSVVWEVSLLAGQLVGWPVGWSVDAHTGTFNTLAGRSVVWEVGRLGGW